MAEFDYKRWGVSLAAKQPLLDFLVEGLRMAGCTVLFVSDARFAPFHITFETPLGERHGVLAYAFLANSRVTRNRPADEHRFQIKYGSNTEALLPVEQDPSKLVTTLFVGIDTERHLLVAADPVMHDHTPMFKSVEFKRNHAETIAENGWCAWERDSRREHSEPIEVLVGVTQSRVLDLIQFERMAVGMAPGHRHLLAEQVLGTTVPAGLDQHALTKELELNSDQVLDLIQGASRLKMAVRGWVAEHHLEQQLQQLPGIQDCRRLDEEGRPDIELRYKGSKPILIECKNALRTRSADGSVRVDFQRTRSSKNDPCSRYYRPEDFHVLATCLHSVTERWEYRFIPTSRLASHPRCEGRIQSNLRVGPDWYENPTDAFNLVTST